MDGVNGPDDYLRSEGDRAMWRVLENADYPWGDAFARYENWPVAWAKSFVTSVA